jgi:hypothetical protein
MRRLEDDQQGINWEHWHFDAVGLSDVDEHEERYC